MTQRDITLRLAVANAEKAIRDLRTFGDSGDRALGRIEKSSQPAARGLQSVNAAAIALSRTAPQLGTALAALGGGLAGLAVVGVAAVAAGLATGTRNAEQAEQSFLRLEGVLRATGGAAGLTANEINNLGQELERSTLATKDGVNQAAAVLATFRSISGEVFTDTLRLAQDLAAVFGGNLSSQATQLGKALEDPIQGLTALRRVGVSFTQDQRDVIAALVETGEVAEAQRKILEVLERQVGGAGAAEASGLTGAFSRLKAEFNDFLEEAARGSGLFDKLSRDIERTAGLVGSLRAAFASNPLGDLAAIRAEIAGLQAELGVTDPASGLRGAALTALDQADTRARIAALQEQERALARVVVAEQGSIVVARLAGKVAQEQAEAERQQAAAREAAAEASKKEAAETARAAAAAEQAAQRRAEAIAKTIGGLQAEVDQQARLRAALGESERAHKDVSRAIEIENELRAAGLDLTSAQGQELARLVTLRQDEAEALERLANSQRFLAEQESDRIRKLEDRGFDPAQQARDMAGRTDEARRAAEREQAAAVTKQVRPLRPSAAARIAAAVQ